MREPSGTSDPKQRPAQTRRFDAIDKALLLLAFLAFAIRIFQLDGQSIWWDEGISLHLATSSLAEIIADRLDNIHPPLYFIVLKGWLALSGGTVFSARYLSVLAGWLQVAMLYGVAARWFGRRTGLVAAFLSAISAVSVIYSQEIRVYSVLPLAYLALLAITRELTTNAAPPNRSSWKMWLALVVVSWLALHLHYVSLFAVVYVSAWALFAFLRSGRWRKFWTVILLQSLVIVASLPWFIPAVRNWAAISGEANAGTFVADPVPLDHLIAQVWTFHLTGLAGAMARSGVAAFAALTALVLVLLVTGRLLNRSTRRPTAVLLAHWLIPLTSALLVWLVRSFSHPRYVAMFVPGLLLLAAYVVLPDVSIDRKGLSDFLTKTLAMLLAILYSGLSLWGLSLYFFDEGAAKDDIRGAARLLEKTTDIGDLILVPDTDWSLPFTYQGPAQVAMPGLEGGEDYWQNLAQLTVGAPRVTTLDYEQGTRDWQNVVPFALHKAGRLEDEIDLDELQLRTYVLDQPVSEPEFASVWGDFGPLALTGVWVEQGAPAGDAIAVALQWQSQAPGDLHATDIALRLLDEGGRILSYEDDRLLDGTGRPGDQWLPGEIVNTFHLLSLPPATPPLSYSIGVELYEQKAGEIRPFDLLDETGAPKGRTFLLSGIETNRGVAPLSEKEFKLTDSLLDGEAAFEPGLVLRDAAVAPGIAAPGSSLSVTLLWWAAHDLPDLRPQLVLIQDGSILATHDLAPVGGRYPTSQWVAGEEVLENRELFIPPGSAGQAQLLLRLGKEQIHLADINIEQGDHVFARPPIDYDLDAAFGDVARLVGYNLPEGAFSTAEAVPLTLLWQATGDGPRADYAIFTHLLAADGSLIGQHDSPPAQGARPVSGWLGGEYILDHHDLTFRDKTYHGPATLEVGLYDPLSGERVLLADGSDHLALPLQLSVVAAE